MINTRRGILFLSCFLFAGCMTAKLPSGPDIYSLNAFEDHVLLGIPKVNDTRENTTLGSLGVESVKAPKKELSLLVTNYLVNTLNSSWEVNVERLAPLDEGQIAGLLAERKLDNILVAEIVGLRLFSLDTVFQPIKAKLDLWVRVYDGKPNPVFNAFYAGEVSDWVGLNTTERKMGLIVDAAVKNAMTKMLEDQALKQLLTRGK